MMLKHCHCGAQATVEMQGRFFCGQHAYDKIMATKGVVPPLKAVR